jgi:hypothetical protein
MKKFNLEAAKSGTPLITRDGRNARFIGHIPELDESERLMVFIEGDDELTGLWENGSYNGDLREEDDEDLFLNIPPVKLMWIKKPGERFIRVQPATDAIVIGSTDLSGTFECPADLIGPWTADA